MHHAIFDREGASLGCMSYICRVFSILFSLVVMSCSQDLTDMEIVYEYDPEWGAAYYLGDEGDVSNFKLVLTAGRTDEEENLISSGAILSLHLSAPLNEYFSLPDGKYLAASSTGAAYTFDFGSVTTRQSGSKLPTIFALESGIVFVERAEDGTYRIKAEVAGQGRSFEFDYDGEMRTFNLATPII